MVVIGFFCGVVCGFFDWLGVWFGERFCVVFLMVKECRQYVAEKNTLNLALRLNSEDIPSG